MAEEAQYAASAPESASLKRKYDEPPTHKPTGFSSPHSTISDIELAKQRAQEVAARLFSGAPPLDLKRSKPDNGAPPSGFDSIDVKAQYPVSTYQTSSKKIEIPNGRVGVIIGKGGETIKSLQMQSDAKIQVTRDMDADPNSPYRLVELVGSAEAIAYAEKLINEVLAEAESGGSGVGRRMTGQAGSGEEFSMQIPNNKVGLIIGKGGETIKTMQANSGARIQVIPLHLPPGDPSTERTLKIDGSPEQIESAKQLVNQIINGENRPRNSTMSGGYSQQGYQSRPPSSWAPPAASTQQSAYGYMQPGAYPGQAPQYNMPQAQYPGYPPQQAGGYSTNWDQSTQQPNQQAGAGGYDYYSQQPQQNPGGSAPSADGSTYNYSQQPSSGYTQQGQGYGQDGYSAYNAPPQSGYGQPATYDQQQGYGSAPSYGSSNPAQEGSYAAQGDSSQAASVPPSTTPQQGYATNPQPNSTGNYPPQGAPQQGYGAPPPTSQAAYGNPPQSGYGYGPPQSVKPSGTPPVYGQSQSPSTAGGYGQSAYPAAQPPPAGSGYAQPESAPQKAPTSGYGGGGAAQPGYGGPQSYGAPQGGYGQAPPSYGNSSYGAGYAQTPAYSSDGTNGAPAPAAAAAQQGGVAKASPPS